MIKSLNRRLLIGAAALYVTAEAVLGVLVQTTSGRACAIISYSCIILNMIFALILTTGKAKSTLTSLGLLFTLFADYFLVYSEDAVMLPAMCFFNLTQLAYAVRIFLSVGSRRERIVQLSVRAAVMILGATLPVIVLGKGADALSVISIMYFANLLLNAVLACVGFKRSPFLAIGLLLFIGCDLFVGFGALHMYFTITEGSLLHALAYPAINVAWLFYVPSQALRTLSVLKSKLELL